MQISRHTSQDVPWTIRNRWLNSLTIADHLNVKISHIFQEGNYVVDNIASNKATTPGVQSWQFNAPAHLLKLFYRDMVPIPFYKFRNL